MTTHVAVRGIGLVTPFGRGVDIYWQALLRGRVALTAPTDPAAFGGTGAPVGRVPAKDLGGTDNAARSPRVAAREGLLRAVLADALADCGVDRMPARSWLFLVGQVPAIREPVPADAVDFLDAAPPRDLVGEVAQVVDLSHACASALFGLALAREAICGGLTRFAVVAGATVLNRFDYASMHVVRAISDAAARPFDVRRAGISLGEGAGAVVLQAADDSADLLLAGCACRVSGTSSSALDEREAFDSMRAALDDAGRRSPEYVHAHATGTAQGDAAELRAVAKVARQGGLECLPASSHKGAIGHLLHASGFVSLASAAQALRSNTVPPTPGLVEPDVVDHVALPVAPMNLASPLQSALVNAFGFGGNHASAMLCRS